MGKSRPRAKEPGYDYNKAVIFRWDIHKEIVATFSLFALGQNGEIQADQLKTILELFCRYPLDEVMLDHFIKEIREKPRGMINFRQFSQWLLPMFVRHDAGRYLVDVKSIENLDPIHRAVLARSSKDEIELFELSHKMAKGSIKFC